MTPRNLMIRSLAYFAVGATAMALALVPRLYDQPVMLVEPKDDQLVILNGCVISACNYLALVRSKKRLDAQFWSRVLLVRYKDVEAGHAYCVWETDGQVFGYDRAGGAFPIPGGGKDPKGIASTLATGLEKVLGRPMIVVQAEFIEPVSAKLYAY